MNTRAFKWCNNMQSACHKQLVPDHFLAGGGRVPKSGPDRAQNGWDQGSPPPHRPYIRGGPFLCTALSLCKLGSPAPSLGQLNKLLHLRLLAVCHSCRLTSPVRVWSFHVNTSCFGPRNTSNRWPGTGRGPRITNEAPEILT